nr:(-)-germacrene D synthase-like [Ipomoea trifida]
MDMNGNSSGRRSVTYHPSVWGDYFLAYDSQLTEIDPSEEREVQQLKEEVRKAFIAAPPASLEKLELIDKIQRLGVDYHFENEIEASIRHIFENYDDCNKEDDENNLYIVALRFRLLRQEGHHISCGVFEKFLDKNGKFKDSLAKDVKGMLSLYEAAYLGVHGETTLDEALTFTTGHLESMLPGLNKLAAAQVTHALKMPIRRTLPRVGAREYMPIYQQDQTHNKVLLRFAKLDFNLLQKVHQRELSGITRLMDDIIGHEFEQERGHVVSAVECYTKEYNVSEQEAYVEIENLISKAWKDLNQECLRPIPVPMKVLLRIMNLTRVIFLLYKDKDNYTFSQVKMKYFINTILVQPVTI